MITRNIPKDRNQKKREKDASMQLI